MPSLQVRTPFPGLRPLVLLSKAISFTVLVILLCAGWVGVSLLKNQASNRRALVTPATVSANSTVPAIGTAVNVVPASEAQQQVTTRLVYSCAADKTYYHDAKHMQAACERIAISEEAATSRGLKPCARCFAK